MFIFEEYEAFTSDAAPNYKHMFCPHRVPLRNICKSQTGPRWTRAQKFITKTLLFKYIENFTTKQENLQMKNFDTAQNLDCVYSLEPPGWGGSNEYPQSIFLSKNKKNNLYPSKPQFY